MTANNLVSALAAFVPSLCAWRSFKCVIVWTDCNFRRV
ncbi:hypothetical protein CSUI_009303 [Cystoisospora suis]|uniref:Uncharacterized protein n=1 Tax=Cystoisospora suis TaxID=483139 RepID=A0A2C6KIE1_9APIC|nr:hypothetical protein CSUI_009303 [Cystoisospora suis]